MTPEALRQLARRVAVINSDVIDITNHAMTLDVNSDQFKELAVLVRSVKSTSTISNITLAGKVLPKAFIAPDETELPWMDYNDFIEKNENPDVS